MKFRINKTYSLSQLTEVVKNKLDRSYDPNGNEKYIPENIYDIYISRNESLNQNSILYVGESVKVDEKLNEIYPKEVIANGYEFHYSCQNFQDIIELVFKHKCNPTIDDIIHNLNVYSEKDNYLNLY